MYFDFLIAFLIVLLLAFSLRVANQYERAVVFRLGRYRRTAGPGLYLLLPFVEWQVKVDLRTQTTAVAPQEAITLDNVPIKINAVIWQRVVNPQRAVIEVTDVGNAVIQVAVTALRNVIGQHALDDVLKAQSVIAETPAKFDRRGDGTLGRQGRARADEGYRNPGLDAARHGAGGRGAPREARPGDQGAG